LKQQRPVSRQAVPSPGGSPAGEISVEQVRKKYLKEHFSYIRDLIVKKLDYPPVARRMEWSGRVILAFVVAEDGDVRSVQIKESSGYPLLDNSAVDTVKRVAPFPRPPVSAEIVMPVHFKLQ
jgi:periplasmic protein TonB